MLGMHAAETRGIRRPVKHGATTTNPGAPNVMITSDADAVIRGLWVSPEKDQKTGMHAKNDRR